MLLCMSDDQFTKLFRYIEDFRADMTCRLNEKASQKGVDQLTNTVDGLSKRIEYNDIEQAASGSQFGKLVGWAR